MPCDVEHCLLRRQGSFIKNIPTNLLAYWTTWSSLPRDMMRNFGCFGSELSFSAAVSRQPRQNLHRVCTTWVGALTNSENGGKRNVCKSRSSVNCIAHEIRSAFVMSVVEHCPFGGPSIVEQRNLYNVCLPQQFIYLLTKSFQPKYCQPNVNSFVSLPMGSN
jgi:hypothetical protein